MRRAADDADFRKSPVGACVAGRAFLYYWPRAHLCGFALWGRADEEDTKRLEPLLRGELAPGVAPHVSLVDASRLEAVDARAFEGVRAYVERNRARLGEQVERLAIVRPPGVAGATVAGFFHVAEAPYPVRVFERARAALAWLGEPDDGVLDAIDEAVADAAGAPPLLAALRRVLDARPGRVRPAQAARAVGVSVRSLQRYLQRAGSTYQTELAAAQVRAAQRLMLASSAPLGAIALDVGCATPQHFSALFRRITGESPSAWRARHARPRP